MKQIFACALLQGRMANPDSSGTWRRCEGYNPASSIAVLPMKLSEQQLSQYCERIGYSGSLYADLPTLQALHLHHPQAIAFENLDSWCGQQVSLDPDGVFNKLVLANRGGYCFEQNLLFSRVLRTIGFGVTGMAARVLWNVPLDAQIPRTHQTLLVDVASSRYLADVGFGGLTPLAPIRFTPGQEQATPLETFRLDTSPHGYQLEVHLNDNWKPMYSFTMEPANSADYQQGNWYVSTYPQSRFVCHLIAACVRNNTRHNLFNRLYTEYPHKGEPAVQEIDNVDTLRHLLVTTFGLTLDSLQNLEPRLLSLFQTEVSP